MASGRGQWLLFGGIGLVLAGVMLNRRARKAVADAVANLPENITGRSAKVIASLDPSIQAAATQFFQQAKAAGYNIVLAQGRRTIAEQDALYAQGRTASGQVVTKAKGGESSHNFGLSFDFAFANRLGQPTWPEDAPWAEVAAIGKRLGFEWGGDWVSFKDRPHLEWPTWRQAQAAWRAGNLAVA